MRNFIMKVIWLAGALIALALPAYPKQDALQDNPDLFIECVMSHSSCYERQPVPAVITLFSTSQDVATADPIALPKLNRGEFATFQPVQPAGSAYKEQRNGKVFYCYPLYAFMFSMPEKGKYSLEGGEYKIGVQVPVVYHDPFWGNVRGHQMKEFRVPVKKCSFSVKVLPAPPAEADFSGSVGNFEIETIIPPGDIFINESAKAVVVLRGTGMIAESTMPVYLDAFSDGVSLKSVQESRTAYYDHGRMVSELHLECTFIPTKIEDTSIGEIYFDFFNPDTGKYQRAKSRPVKINVKSSVLRRQHIDI